MPTETADLMSRLREVAATSGRDGIALFVADLATTLGLPDQAEKPKAKPSRPADATAEKLLAAVASGLDPPALLTADQAARLLSISRASFFRGVAAGKLPPAVQSPGGPRYKRAEILKSIEKMKAA